MALTGNNLTAVQGLLDSGILGASSSIAKTNNLTPKFSYLGQDPTTNPTSGFKAYDPSAGVMGESEGWGNTFTYRSFNPYKAADKGPINYKAMMDWVRSGKGSYADLAKQNKNPGFLASLQQGVYSEYDDLVKRRDESPIYKQLSQLQQGGQLNYGTKGLSAQNAMETIAGRFSRYGITDLNQVGAVSQGGKTVFYNKLTGQALPDRIGYTTYGDGMTNFNLTTDAQGNVIPLSAWKDTSTNIGGLALGGLAALAAPWAIPAIGSGLGVGAAAAGGIYGAGAGALTSAASGGNLLTGALTGGLGGALGGGLLGDVTGVGAGASEAAAGSLGSTGNVMGDILGGSITSGAGASGLISAAPIGSTIGGVAGGMLNPALAGGLAGIGSSAGSLLGGTSTGGFDTSYLSNASSGGQQVMDAVPGSSDYGLNSLPNAGTMPNTATPALGAGAGEWTLPEALTNVPGATQAASGSTLGAGLALSPGSGLTTLGGGAAASGASSVTDFLSNLFSKGADKFMENPLQNTVGILSALSATSQGKDLADQLKALMNQGLSQSDPFGSQRAQYAAKLKQTYDDPNTYLGSDEYKGISRKRLEALERADAAQGRKSQYGARAEKMYEFDQENLNKERTMLGQLAGSGIQPGQVGNILNTLGAGSANAQVNANGQLYALLASMVKGS